jgi:hypothetical protein
LAEPSKAQFSISALASSIALQKETAMNFRTILFCCVLCAIAMASAAEQPRERIYLDAVSGARIDLDAVSGSGSSKAVFARVSFVEIDSSRCPEDSGQLRISGGTLGQTRMALRWDPEGQGSANGWRSTLNPSDDETYQYRVALPDCRTDVAIRQQVRVNGAWRSLLVRRELRPSVPMEERRELERRRLELERQSRESSCVRLKETPGEVTATQCFESQAAAAARPGDSLHEVPISEVPISRQAFFFDDTPPTCFDGTGAYRVKRSEVIFSFFTLPSGFFIPSSGIIFPLPPGDVNGFLIERADFDETRGRLDFTRGDCRWVLTISQSIRRNGQWTAIPLATMQPL